MFYGATCTTSWHFFGYLKRNNSVLTPNPEYHQQKLIIKDIKIIRLHY